MSAVTETPVLRAANPHELLLMVRELVQGMKGYEPLPDGRRRKLNVSGHVDDDYLRAIAIMLEASPDLEVASKLTAAEVREHIQYHGEHAGIGEELIILGRGAKDTLVRERSSVGRRALQAVVIAKTLDAPEDQVVLFPHLKDMQRNFIRGKRRRAKPEPPAPAREPAPGSELVIVTDSKPVAAKPAKT